MSRPVVEFDVVVEMLAQSRLMRAKKVEVLAHRHGGAVVEIGGIPARILLRATRQRQGSRLLFAEGRLDLLWKLVEKKGDASVANSKLVTQKLRDCEDAICPVVRFADVLVILISGLFDKEDRDWGSPSDVCGVLPCRVPSTRAAPTVCLRRTF